MNDQELIKGCLDGKSDCEKILYDRYAATLFGVCLRYSRSQMEAEDIMQDGFIKIFRKLHTFKFEGSFEGWCRRIMVNTAIKYLKKGSNKNEFSNLDEVKEERYESKAIGIITEKELLELISKLPQGYKTVFNLHVIEGYKHTEIAEMLGITESTSRTQFLKARKVLQSALKKMQLLMI